jgi:hypothetical protein
MPARKRRQEGKKSDSWTLMLREDVRSREEARIRRDHPDVAKALDWMATRFPVFMDGHGWTVFTDWVLQYIEKAKRQWPDDIPRFDASGLYNPVFPSLR